MIYDVTPPLRVPVALSFGFVCWRAHAHRVGRNPSETTISINRSVVVIESNTDTTTAAATHSTLDNVWETCL